MTEAAEILQEMEQYAAAHRVPIINAGGRRIFVELIEQYRPKRILEIGTAIGYSALLTLSRTRPDAHLTSLELSEERWHTAQAFLTRCACAARVQLLQGDAEELLEALAMQQVQPFDFVFIDAAKGQYPVYFSKVQPLLAPDGVILADNVLFRGYVQSDAKPPRRYRTIVKRLRTYLRLVQAPPFQTEIFAKGDGLALTRRIYEEET